ncbi:hypothetical protein M8D54_004963 [Salmonella enterica]|uniref:Uncharacterized protein n=1 Tax=Salmonella enterica TaxID=28901 RepID=A0A629KHT2_SALER|nr:hypothetical protein [Salmonella enterica]EDF8922140.1 hypothetical protein [Salmonella enterica]EGR6194421.1 hypothetical protein [Salmonella enterica]EHR7428489.1 hypothetical protein [Salmonella enterica]EJF2005545.1 hypothetical protein [Salmonella enterica]
MKKTVFSKLSRRKRRSLVIDLKNKIRNEKAEYGGKILSDVYFNTIDKGERNQKTRHWIDVYFPSKTDPALLWNTTIITCLQDLEDKAEHLAFEDARKGLTEEEYHDILNLETIPILDKNGKVFAHEQVFKEQNRKVEFSGRTYYEEIDYQKEQNIKRGVFDIYERYEIYKDYAYGLGLTIVVNEKNLDQEAVERAIENFYKRGEKTWTDDKPVDKKELIKLYNEVFKKTNCGSAEIKMD